MEKAMPAAFALALLLALPLQASAYSFTGYVQPLGDVADVAIPDTGLSVERLNFYVPDTDGRFTLRVDSVSYNQTPPEVYQYFNIDTVGLSTPPAQAIIDFRVGKEWINESRIEPSTIMLSICDVACQPLDIIKIGEDDDFVHFRAESDALAGFFAVSGTPNPVDITFRSGCNGNGVCEPDLGEDSETCSDCLEKAGYTKCVPLENTCLGDSLLSCSSDGKNYDLTPCDFGCADGECLSQGDALTGLAIAGGPAIMAVIAALVAVVAYLAISLNGVRKRLRNVEGAASRL